MILTRIVWGGMGCGTWGWRGVVLGAGGMLWVNFLGEAEGEVKNALLGGLYYLDYAKPSRRFTSSDSKFALQTCQATVFTR